MNTKPIEQPAVASALDRIGARRILQRIGVVHEPASGLPSDTPEVRQLLTDDAFDEALERLARKLDRDVSGVKAEAAGYLREMSATHSARVDKVWDGFGRWLNRAHDVEVDEEQARRVRALSRKHSLLFLMSHRSYLDGFTLPVALAAHGIEAPFTMGGANLNFFPVGAIARRTGVVFIRRSTSDLPVYRSGVAFLYRPAHPQSPQSVLVDRGWADPDRKAATAGVRDFALRHRRPRRVAGHRSVDRPGVDRLRAAA